MFASSKPKVPTLYRIRNDQRWDDVVYRWRERIVIPTGGFVVAVAVVVVLPLREIDSRVACVTTQSFH